MRNIFFSLFLAFVCTFSRAQELNCTVKVNAQQLYNASLSVFKTLETSLTDFVNKTESFINIYKYNNFYNIINDLINIIKERISLYFNVDLKTYICHTSSWLNWIEHSTSNREVPGSSPGEDSTRFS